jgi:hydroxyethylthiazole kinase
MKLLQSLAATIGMVRAQKPLIHHLTNYVTVNDCANSTLAIGASPVMATDAAEMEDMVSMAGALVLNIGTLTSLVIESMLIAGKRAKQLEIPVIFDPVGVGATGLRTSSAKRIIDAVGPTVIRGNMSEIMTLAGLSAKIKGVDSLADELEAEVVARNLSKKLGCVVVITGKTDFIARENDLCRVANGHAMMTGITGTGCMATSLVGACCAANGDAFVGAAAGIVAMGIAGELAQKMLGSQEGLGTYRVRLIDVISQMTPELMLSHGKIS